MVTGKKKKYIYIYTHTHTPVYVYMSSFDVSRLSAMVSSSLPPPEQLSSLDANSATDTFCSTLTSCLDTVCPLSSRPARTTPWSAPWLSDVLHEHRSKLRAAESVWRKSQNPSDLNVYKTLLSSFSATVSTAKRTYYHTFFYNSSNSCMLFKTFSSLLCPPPPSTLTADDFATFFITKIKTISAQFSTPQSVKHILPANIHWFTSFSSLSETEVSKLILSSHPTTCPLDPIPSHLLQAISPAVVPVLTHIVNTSLYTGVFPLAFSQTRITHYLRNPPLTHLFKRTTDRFPFYLSLLKHLNALCSTKSLPFSHRTTSSTATSLVSEVDIQPRLPWSQLLKP